MGKLKVNKGQCIGCGACAQIDPDHFELDDNGLSIVINDTPGNESNEAIDSCPVSAINISDEDCSCDNCECDCEECDCEECDCEECDCDECNCDECNCDECNHE